MSGPAPGDRHTAEPPPRPFAESASEPPGKLRIALSLRSVVVGARVHAEVERALRETGDLLRSLGHDVAEFDPAYNELLTIFAPRYLRGIRDEALTVPRYDRLQRRTRQFAAMGSAFSNSVMEWTRRDEPRQATRVFRVFEQHDVLITPTIAKPPVKVGQWEGVGAPRAFNGMALAYPFTAPWNALGNPAAAVPAGFTPDGLPLSVQLVGRPNDEGTLLSLAAQIEAERPWAEQRPALAIQQ